jgi:serine/threonine protein kinase
MPEVWLVDRRVLVGRYRLERILGEGASGRVYLARDTRERGRVWAVKELDYSGLPPDDFLEARQQFQREAELLKGLRHPSLPAVADHFQEGPRDYLVMERVEGPTLEGLLRSGPLPEARVVNLGLALAETLHYLHHRRPPIIYRDLKPANVMVTLDGGVKLIDFGIARSVRPGRAGDTTAYGTPGYAPPEQYQGRTVPASDVYALGMTLLRAATLYEPPELSFQAPRASSLNFDISPALEELLASMLQRDPEQRPHTSLIVPMLSSLRDLPSNQAWRVWWRRGSHLLKKWWTTSKKGLAQGPSSGDAP